MARGAVRHHGAMTRTRLGLLFAPLLALALAAGGDPSAAVHAQIRDDARVLRLRDATGRTLHAWTVDAWQAWAAPRWEQLLDEPPRIGQRPLRARDFDRFGFARVAPDGERVAFSVTSYAMLTTLSLVGTLDLDDGEIRMVRRAKHGTVEAPTFAPDGRHLAYALGTARAGGESVRVDDLIALEEVARVDGEDLLDAAGRVAAPEGPPYLPHLRDLAWAAPAVLTFASDPPGSRSHPDRAAPEAVRWRLPLQGEGTLRRLDDQETSQRSLE